MEDMFKIYDAFFGPCAEIKWFLVIQKVRIVPDGSKIKCQNGAKVVFVILWNFHQAVRTAAIVTVLKQGWRLIDWLRNSISEI